jgi:NAD(P)-dependent dehydrogenase (short-subunit alcohol dehydrogenase family)
MSAASAGSSAADGRPRAAAFGPGPGPGGLAGRRALVTGGTRGMGEAVVALLTTRNARVVAAGRHGVIGSPVPVIEADLGSPEGADLAARQAAGMLGGLDIIVHCVGASFPRLRRRRLHHRR